MGFDVYGSVSTLPLLLRGPPTTTCRRQLDSIDNGEVAYHAYQHRTLNIFRYPTVRLHLQGCGASAPVIPFTAVIRGDLANNAGQKVPSDSVLTGKIKLVLFSANVPQVKNFVLRLLAPLSTVLKAKGVEPFEVIFVSDDIEESAFTAYFAEMPR